MTHCASCGRQLKREPIMVNDMPMGPVCASRAPREVAPDLFGYDIESAVRCALERLHFALHAACRGALAENARDFAQARERCGV